MVEVDGRLPELGDQRLTVLVEDVGDEDLRALRDEETDRLGAQPAGSSVTSATLPATRAIVRLLRFFGVSAG